MTGRTLRRASAHGTTNTTHRTLVKTPVPHALPAGQLAHRRAPEPPLLAPTGWVPESHTPQRPPSTHTLPMSHSRHSTEPRQSDRTAALYVPGAHRTARSPLAHAYPSSHSSHAVALADGTLPTSHRTGSVPPGHTRNAGHGSHRGGTTNTPLALAGCCPAGHCPRGRQLVALRGAHSPAPHGSASTPSGRRRHRDGGASDGASSANSARFGKFTRSRNHGFATVSTKTGRAPPVLFKVPRCRTR